jgi:hypothetical protein
VRRLAALGLFLIALLAAAPASAIETSAFGLAPGGTQNRTALHEDVRPGKRTDDTVRVWNKTAQPVTVNLMVQGATINAKGQVHLGGNGGAAGWVRLSSSTVTLAPHASMDVPVTVTGPRKMPGGTSNAAIVAEAQAPDAAHVAVLQRVALMVYASAPSGSPLRAALGWAAWVAVGLLVVVAGFVVQRSRPATKAARAANSRRASSVSGVSASA